MRRTIEVLLSVLISAAVMSCGSETKEEKHSEHENEHGTLITLSKESQKEIGLVVSTVEKLPLTGSLRIPATVITNQDFEAQVGSLVQGRVHRVFVKVGTFVKSGQILMTVEGPDIGEIKAGYLKAKAAYDFARTNFERQRLLFAEKIGSQKSFLEAQAEFEKSQAEFNAEDRRIHSVGLSDEEATESKNDREHTSGTLSIKSPLDGIVIERNVVIGQLVDATTNAFKIVNTKSVWIDGQIYEKDIDRLNEKADAVFTTLAYPHEEFKGRVSYIGQVVDEKTRTIRVRSEFSNPNGRLKPQMFGELSLPVGASDLAIMISFEAVVSDGDQEFVFVRTSDTTFDKRTVVTGVKSDTSIEIKLGLKAGESVVTKGVFYLKSELKKEEIEGDEH